MSRVLYIVNRFVNLLFDRSGIITYTINFILANEYLLIGIVLVIIGFAVGIIYRLIHS